MPPGISHPNYVCWDELDGSTPRADLIAFYQTIEHVRAETGIR